MNTLQIEGQDTVDELTVAHDATRYNREALASDNKCGCFSCLKIFLPSEIEEWCCEEEDGDEVSAICPYCGIDSVIGESSGFPITQEFLQAMYRRWFTSEDDDA